MGFLVGNDFIPHLPHLHINHDALPLLYKTYISVLPHIGGKVHAHNNQYEHQPVNSFAQSSEFLSSLIFQIFLFGLFVYIDNNNIQIK